MRADEDRQTESHRHTSIRYNLSSSAQNRLGLAWRFFNVYDTIRCYEINMRSKAVRNQDYRTGPITKTRPNKEKKRN